MPRANARAVLGVEPTQRGKRLTVVGKRLALAHEHDACGARAKVLGNVHDLVVHLTCGKRAHEAAHAGGAEGAAHAAARLR